MKANILFLHGVNEHSTRYLDISRKFAQNGYACFLFDWYGHGYSYGNKFMGTLDIFESDLDAVISTIPRTVPLFIVAHSMGGGIILERLTRHKLRISGLICVSPFIDIPPRFGMDRLKRAVLGLLPAIFDPFMVNNQIEPNIMVRDPDSKQLIYSDRLMAPIFTIQIIKTFLRISRSLAKNKNRHSFPLFFICGDEDVITPHEYCLKYFNKVRLHR